MDLLKHYGAKELARLTYRDIKSRKKAIEREANLYTADSIERIYKRINDSRRVLGQW